MKDNTKELTTNNTQELNAKNKQELTMNEMEQVAGGFEWLKPIPHG